MAGQCGLGGTGTQAFQRQGPWVGSRVGPLVLGGYWPGVSGCMWLQLDPHRWRRGHSVTCGAL